MTSSLEKWRTSASLLILARTSSHSPFDYDVLMVKRSGKASVFPNVAVFPGGLLDGADTDKEWLKLYTKFGFTSKCFDVLNTAVKNSSLFSTSGSNEIPKCVSLRIAAIRETFEETGILICKNAKNISDQSSPWADYIASEEIRKWQEQVNENPSKFIELCSCFELLPDLWSLNEWSNWVTPTNIEHKFNTIFFIVTLKEKPPTVADKMEVSQVLWKTPQQYLTLCKKTKSFTPMPQFYEISRLHTISRIKDVIKLLKERKRLEIPRYWPYIVRTDFGFLLILPGDDLYPKVIDETNETLDYLKEIPESNVQHRIKIKSNDEKKILIKNYSLMFNFIIPLSSKL